MREADRKRERLLQGKRASSALYAAANRTTNTLATTNHTPAVGESKETKKIRDTNNTTLMLVVVITVSSTLVKGMVVN